MGTVITACNTCHMGCGMEVTVRDSRAVAVRGLKEHPLNQGRLCIKGRSVLEQVYSEKRVLEPLAREGTGWKRLSWDQALERLAEHMLRVKERYGPQAVAIAVGMPVLLSGTTTVGLIHRFAHRFGTPNCFSVESLCYRSRMLGYMATLGRFYTADPLNAACVVVWGHNPDASAPPVARWIRTAKRRGAKLIVVDPRQTPLARLADLHLRVRPGSDGAVLLAMIHVIVEQNLYDQAFVARWCSGFEELRDHVTPYSPEAVAPVAWVSPEEIRELTFLFAHYKPGCIVQGTNSLDQTASGFFNSRAVAALQALTGNIDVPGGFIWVPRLKVNQLAPAARVEQLPLGIAEYPLFYGLPGRKFGEGQLLKLLDAVITGEPYPVKMLVIDGSNPLLTWPESPKVAAALEALEYLAVIDQVMSETAAMADLVLPAATFLERTELCDYYSLWGLPYVMVRKKAVEVGQARPDLQIWLDLAAKLGYGDDIPWRSPEEVLEHVLAPSGFTTSQLLAEAPAGTWYADLSYKKYEDQGFRTPSGKIELALSGRLGPAIAPLPAFTDPLSEQEIATFPLILTTGARELRHMHSRSRELKEEPFAQVHPETAAAYGVSEGQRVLLETEHGSIEIKLRVTESIARGVVSVPHGWAQANVNRLTKAASADPVTGYPNLKAVACRIRRIRKKDLVLPCGVQELTRCG